MRLCVKRHLIRKFNPNPRRNKMKQSNNKRVVGVVAVIGLLAVLATTAHSATSAHAATPSMVGTWNVTIPKSEGNPQPGQSILTFFADGNMVEMNAFANPATSKPGHGVWIASGNTYLMSFDLFTFDDKGKNTGRVRTHLSIKMDGPDRWNATFTGDLIDLAGKVTKKIAYGTADGTRMKVERP
jgi:hypothetical protein